MQYKVDSPEEYIQSLDEDWRKTMLSKVRDMILSNASCSKETIEYKMLAYAFGDKILFHLNAQKNYVSLYIGDVDKVSNGREILKDFDIGKGCIRIKKTIKLENTNLNDFINKVIESWKSGHDVDC